MAKATSHDSTDYAPVAVTGIGAICPLGLSKDAYWNGLLAGTSAIKTITKFDPSDCDTKIGGELPDGYDEFEKERTPRRLIKQSVRASRLIRICAEDAICDSNLPLDALDTERFGAIIGTSGSSVRSPHDLGDTASERHKIIREMVNAISAWIGLDHACRGPIYTVSAADASGAAAVIRSCDLLRNGVLDVAISGGVDCLLTRNYLLRAARLGELSIQNKNPAAAVKPFDNRRDGGVISDGGCALILESHDHALERNARVYAWIHGNGFLTFPCDPEELRPDPEGMRRCMQLAIERSGGPGDSVGYINANGTATPMNDRHETQAIKQVLGERARAVAVSSQKAMIGHCMGGAGALQIAATALTLHSQRVTPTINYEVPDPECDLNYVPNAAIEATGLEAALTNTFGFGGHLCSILMSRSL